MTTCVFIGPTLRPQEVAAALDAVCLPPVAQGDVYRAVQRGARALGIVDGFFSGAPSVWHKEILWALSEGIPVFGSASMGALRAAELHAFGMQGVGRIFEAFRDGVLEDDDEVAVVHGPAEAGFLPASEPMVNVRATLARAEVEGIVDASARAALEQRAKALFFPQRTWAAILGDAAPAPAAALRQWLPQGRVAQKRQDALAMLAAMRETLARGAPARAAFRFERTSHWEGLVASSPAAGGAPAGAADRAVLEELRLEGTAAYGGVRARALARLLAIAEAARRGTAPAPAEMRAALTALRAAFGLFTRGALDQWMVRNDLDGAALERLIAEQVLQDAVVAPMGGALERGLLDELRLAGSYERLAERARDKQRALASVADEVRHGGGAGIMAARLWFFEQRLGRAMPEDVAQFARELGFANLADFDNAVQRERLYFGAKKNRTAADAATAR